MIDSVFHLIRRAVVIVLLPLLGTSTLLAQPWPTYRHDNRRSGVTESKLQFPLKSLWVWKSPHPPQTAWSGPAKWDAYSGNRGLQSMRNFDPCFFVTADDSNVYFGSSVDDAAHALDATSGKERWVHFTGAAVRLPPAISDGRVFFGSDDGSLYCCDQTSGDLLWRKAAVESNRRIASNRKLISLWPVRTGALVDRQRVTFAGSLVPWEKSVLWTVDAKTGQSSGSGCFQRVLNGVTLQGAMLASQKLLYAPQGRAAPLAFDRADGQSRGAVGEAGGVFCILSEDDELFAGPPDQKSADDQIRIASVESKHAIASFSGTNRILVEGDLAWMSIDDHLKLLDRSAFVREQRIIEKAKSDLKNVRKPIAQLKAQIADAERRQSAAWKWSVKSPAPLDMIKAGDALLVGLPRQVRALDAASGRELWRADVEGDVHGLAVADGRLYASTDLGHIHAFGMAP